MQVNDSLLQFDDMADLEKNPKEAGQLQAVMHFLAKTRAVVPDDQAAQQ